MSQENVELVTKAFQAATARPKPDFDMVNALFDPDHVFVPVFAQIDRGELRGSRGFQEFRSEIDAGESLSWDAELDGAVDVGANRVLCVFTAQYRGPTSGAEVEQRAWVVATVRGGRVARTEVYNDPAAALEAVRVRE